MSNRQSIAESIKKVKDALKLIHMELVFLSDFVDRVGACVEAGCKEPAVQPGCVPFCKKHFVILLKEQKVLK